MSEEQENKVNEPEEPESTPATETAEVSNDVTETVEAAPAEPVEQAQPEEPVAETYEQPQVIVQRERGFAHYVGFALISVLCICFFFMPGIAVTFLVSLIPGIALGAVAAWTFVAIFSVIAWAIFKIKIKGFKKSFYMYIGLCILILAIFVAIQVMTEANVFSKIFALLCGADAS